MPLQLYVDSAESGSIARALGTGYVWGVTTNPTLLRHAGLRRGDLPSLVAQAVQSGAQEVHLQVLSATSEAMVDDGRSLFALDPAHVIVKVPATGEGFAAAVRLGGEGIPLTVTAVYTVRQAVLAGAACGARYAAVYLERIRRAGQEPFALIGRMRDAIRAQALALRVLVASVRTVEDVETLVGLGVNAITLPVDLLTTLADVPATAEAVRRFEEDAEHL